MLPDDKVTIKKFVISLDKQQSITRSGLIFMCVVFILAISVEGGKP